MKAAETAMDLVMVVALCVVVVVSVDDDVAVARYVDAVRVRYRC